MFYSVMQQQAFANSNMRPAQDLGVNDSLQLMYASRNVDNPAFSQQIPTTQQDMLLFPSNLYSSYQQKEGGIVPSTIEPVQQFPHPNDAFSLQGNNSKFAHSSLFSRTYQVPEPDHHLDQSGNTHNSLLA